MKTKISSSFIKIPNDNDNEERRNFLSALFFWILGFFFIFPFKKEDGTIGIQRAHAAMVIDDNGNSVSSKLKELNSQLADNAKRLDTLEVPITNFGASTSLTDNISAIQQTINYVDSLGGGTVLIPDGTFYVKPKSGKANNIILKSNITIKGVSRNTSIIKIHKTTGDWGELFSYPTPAAVMYNIKFADLTFDCNINNIVGVPTMWDKHRMWINGGYTYNYLIQNVHFICNGVWAMHGNVMNSRFINNEIEYNTTNVPATWWDVSAVWWGGKNNDISNNIIWSSGNCGFVPETAIEFQGHNFHVHDNKCLGYANGILPTPYTDTTSGVITLDPGGRGIKVYNNSIEVASKGVFIWPMNLTKGYLENLSVYNNTIVITDDVQGAPDPRAGITFKLKTPKWAQKTPVKNIRIYDNYIEYKTRTVSTNLYSGDAGIKFYANVDLTGLEIKNNTIVNCGANGIALHMDTGSTNWIHQVFITGNRFKDVLMPIRLGRNLSEVICKNNLFTQFTTYGGTSDMTYCIYKATNTYPRNVNYVISGNEIMTPGLRVTEIKLQ